MGAKNKVIAGDYTGYTVGGRMVWSGGTGIIFTPGMGWSEKGGIPVNKNTVESYELITDEHRKSAASGVGRGLAGSFLLGPLGLLAGGMSAKSKGIYTVAIKFKDGKNSLVEVDDAVYKELIACCF